MDFIYARSQVTTITNIKRIHKLPRGSVPKVLVGQTVKATEILATAEIAKKYRVVDVAEMLAIKPQRVASYLVKREGDTVEEKETLAVRRAFLRRKRAISPLAGVIVRVENGQMLIEGERDRVDVEATVPGKIVAIEPDNYMVIETNGALLQIAWGFGGLEWGSLKIMDEEPSLVTDATRFNIDHRGSIVAIGSPLTPEFLQGAKDIRVKGIIASSMHASLLPLLDDLGFPVGLTQGFGALPMSTRILSLLKTYNGREIAMDMGTASNWRNKKPEIIIPLSSQQQVMPEDDRSAVLLVGNKVRVLQAPYLGDIGTVTELSEQPRRLPGGMWETVTAVEVASSETIFVPIANLEHLG